MAHDDILHNEASQDSLDPVAFVSVDLSNSPIISNTTTNSDPTASQYHVTMEDGEEAETGKINLHIRQKFTINMALMVISQF